MVKCGSLCRVLIGVFIMLFVTMPLYGKDDGFAPPKDYGVYIKTQAGLKRLLPNIVLDEKGMLLIETNNPPRFALKDMEYFVIYGRHNLDILTINPLIFQQASALGKGRFIFGKNIEFVTQKRPNNLFVVKPKGLMGRGYFALWIEDTAWDFLIE